MNPVTQHTQHTQQNIISCPILKQNPVIVKIKYELVDKLDLQNASSKEIQTCARNLSAFMRSCKTLYGKIFLQESMGVLKEKYFFTHWNEKYPLFLNDWTPKDLDRKRLFPEQLQVTNKGTIVKTFPLIKKPELIKMVIEKINPIDFKNMSKGLNQEERLKLMQENAHYRTEQIYTICVLFLTCKSFYNCKPIRELYTQLKEAYLFRNNKITQIGEDLYPYPGGPGWLSEIFLTGWPDTYDSLELNQSVSVDCPVSGRQWNETHENDAKKIIELFPQSLNYLTLRIRGIHSISPFIMACFNERVPLPMIEFLIENKADPEQKCVSHKYSGKAFDFSFLGEEIMGTKRYNAILKILGWTINKSK